MSEEVNVEHIKSCDNIKSTIMIYSTRLAERTIERALDIIYEESNIMDLKIHEWRHSFNELNVSTN